MNLPIMIRCIFDPLVRMGQNTLECAAVRREALHAELSSSFRQSLLGHGSTTSKVSGAFGAPRYTRKVLGSPGQFRKTLDGIDIGVQ